MKELSLNILDVAKNSVRAKAKNVEISLVDKDGRRTLTITDDGVGMDEELLLRVTDPFATTRTTRPVGLGLPLLKLAAEQTGGYIAITSKKEKDDSKELFAAGADHGTRVKAVFDPRHIDCVPLGDVAGTVTTLIQGDPDIEFRFEIDLEDMAEPFELDTKEIKQVLGSEVPIDSPQVLLWVGDCIKEALSTQIN